MANSVRDEAVVSPSANNNAEMSFAFNTNEVDERFPLSSSLIAREQRKDKTLQHAISNEKSKFSETTIEGTVVVTYNKKVYIPKSLNKRVVAWYHEYLRHPGETRMEATLRQTLYWPTLRQDVHDLVSTCEKCQRCKKQQKKYGKLPAKVAESSIPWNRVCIDMIGPYTIETTSGEKHQLRCLTMIDPATGWFEIKALKRATAEAAMEAFDDVWLSRYP